MRLRFQVVSDATVAGSRFRNGTVSRRRFLGLASGAVDATSGALADVTMVPFQTVCFQLKRARGGDPAWLQRRLGAASDGLGTRVELASDGVLRLRW